LLLYETFFVHGHKKIGWLEKLGSYERLLK